MRVTIHLRVSDRVKKIVSINPKSFFQILRSSQLANISRNQKKTITRVPVQHDSSVPRTEVSLKNRALSAVANLRYKFQHLHEWASSFMPFSHYFSHHHIFFLLTMNFRPFFRTVFSHNDLIWSVLFRYFRSAHNHSKPSLFRCVIYENEKTKNNQF